MHSPLFNNVPRGAGSARPRLIGFRQTNTYGRPLPGRAGRSRTPGAGTWCTNWTRRLALALRRLLRVAADWRRADRCALFPALRSVPHLSAHLVAALADAGTDGGMQVFGARPEAPAHGGDGMR